MHITEGVGFFTTPLYQAKPVEPFEQHILATPSTKSVGLLPPGLHGRVKTNASHVFTISAQYKSSGKSSTVHGRTGITIPGDAF